MKTQFRCRLNPMSNYSNKLYVSCVFSLKEIRRNPREQRLFLRLLNMVFNLFKCTKFNYFLFQIYPQSLNIGLRGPATSSFCPYQWWRSSCAECLRMFIIELCFTQIVAVDSTTERHISKGFRFQVWPLLLIAVLDHEAFTAPAFVHLVRIYRALRRYPLGTTSPILSDLMRPASKSSACWCAHDLQRYMKLPGARQSYEPDAQIGTS